MYIIWPSAWNTETAQQISGGGGRLGQARSRAGSRCSEGEILGH